MRGRFFAPKPAFQTLADLNGWLADKCVEYARSQRHPEQSERTVFEVFEAERNVLMTYRGAFDGFHATSAAVSKTCLVRFDNNKDSVKASAVGRPVDVHAYADRVVIKQDGIVVGEHARAFGRNQTTFDPWRRAGGALTNKDGCRCWPASPVHCATVRRSRTGRCRRLSVGSVPSSQARTKATGRWSRS